MDDIFSAATTTTFLRRQAATGAHVGCTVLKGYEESCTGGLNVVGVSVGETATMGYDRTGGGETIVGVGCGADEQIHFFGFCTGGFEQTLHTFYAHEG